MQDAIIKGTGNSRYLKSVSDFLTLYPTYEDMARALIEGSFPVDFNGINAGGWAQQGTPLNKVTLLSDAVAASLGLGTDATVSEALAVVGVALTGTTAPQNSLGYDGATYVKLL